MEKTVNLKMPGVMEMSKEEMKCIDGGCVILCLIAGALIGAVLTQDLDDLGDAFKEGRAS